MASMLPPIEMLQVHAFWAEWKYLGLDTEGCPNMRYRPCERFIEAIVRTSDDRFAKLKRERPELIEQWLRENKSISGQRKRRERERKDDNGNQSEERVCLPIQE